MANKRMAALPLTVIIGLSVLGFVYAMWSDQAWIVGRVDMGTLQVVFNPAEPVYCVEKYWNESATAWYPLDPLSGEYLGKDVGDCKAENGSVVWNKPHTKWGWETFSVNITDAYPSYTVMIRWSVHNIGSVPAYFDGFGITGYYMVDTTRVDLTYKTPSAEPDWGPYPGYWQGDICKENVPIINVHTTNTIGFQLDPCNDTKGEIDLHFKQLAEECHTYYLEFEFLWVNKIE